MKKKNHSEKTSLDNYREIRKPMPKPSVIHDNTKKKNVPSSEYKNIPVDPNDLDSFDDLDPEDLDF